MIIEKFYHDWLLGTTCHRPGRRSVFWISGCKNFVIMKHHGHSEYINRFTGTQRCGTYYVLYDIRHPLDSYGRESALKKWEGKWKKEYMKEVCDKLKETK